MFIRFFSGEIDERSHYPAGLFCAAHELSQSDTLPWHDFDGLIELMNWFNVHLASPFDYLPHHRWYDRAICWFKPDAREHLMRAWELVSILELNDVHIWTLKVSRVGYVHYEDEAQVFARPFYEIGRLL